MSNCTYNFLLGLTRGVRHYLGKSFVLSSLGPSRVCSTIHIQVVLFQKPSFTSPFIPKNDINIVDKFYILLFLFTLPWSVMMLRSKKSDIEFLNNIDVIFCVKQ